MPSHGHQGSPSQMLDREDPMPIQEPLWQLPRRVLLVGEATGIVLQTRTFLGETEAACIVGCEAVLAPAAGRMVGAVFSAPAHLEDGCRLPAHGNLGLGDLRRAPGIDLLDETRVRHSGSWAISKSIVPLWVVVEQMMVSPGRRNSPGGMTTSLPGPWPTRISPLLPMVYPS